MFTIIETLDQKPSPSPAVWPSNSTTPAWTSSRLATQLPQSRPIAQMSAQPQANMATALMSERAREVVKEAMIGRNCQSYIYSQTRGTIGVRTKNMFAYALRDYQRHQYAPMKRTRPALTKRRYSVDVSTFPQERKVKRVSTFTICNKNPPTLSKPGMILDSTAADSSDTRGQAH